MPKLTDVHGRPHAGNVPWVVVGIVTDNVDPDEMGRIKVKFPTLVGEGDVESWWLRQVTPNGGAERGFYALPEAEDEVLVCFMEGATETGVILGQFWNGVDIPPAEAKDGMPKGSDTDTGGNISTATFTDGSGALDTNDRRFWKSRSGHLIVMDDTDGSESVTIWNNKHTLCLAFDTAENLITLSNTKGDIEIRAKNDILIDAGNDFKWYAKNNVEGESKMDTKFKAGNNWEMEASMDCKEKSGMGFKIEAGMDFEAKASMNCKLEGSMNFGAKGGIEAKLEGSAMGVVKGGVVMIN